MNFAILFVLVAAAAAEATSRLSPLNPTGRIVGGQDTSINQVPYQISLDVFGIHVCSGSIIADAWVLIAAQCLVYFPSWYTVRSGTNLRSGGGVSTPLAFAITHDNYRVNAFGIPINDIALIRLRASLIFGSTQAPISMFASGQEAVVGSPGIVSGWGAVSEGGNAPAVLQTVTIPIVSKADCNAAYSFVGGLPAGQICTAVPGGGRGACNGDTGAPLAINGVLAGLVSWSNGCARPGFPGVYSEVAAYRSWIRMISGI